MADDKQIDVLERILKFVGDYGVSLVFLVACLIIMLVAVIETIRMARKWVPAWFSWSIKSHQRTIKFLDAATETLTCVHDKNHAIVESNYHMAEAALAAAAKNRQEFGNDAIIHLQTAADTLAYARNTSSHNTLRSVPPLPKAPHDSVSEGDEIEEPDEPSPIAEE